MTFQRKARVGSTVITCALSLVGCFDEGSRKYSSDHGQKNYESRIEKVFDSSELADDWKISPELRVVEPHGDGDGAGSYEQTYYDRFTSRTVPGFQMFGFVKVPPDDTMSFEQRTSGMLDVQAQRVEGLPDAEGFMRLVASEHKSVAIVNIVQDGTMSSRYPGKTVYRLVGPKWKDVPSTSTEPGKPDLSEPDDWHEVFANIDNSKGPLVGYDEKTGQWTTLTKK